MTALRNSPAATNDPSGPSKAERLEYMTEPFGPTFPLDDDVLEDLVRYPGPIPRDARHYLRLLEKARARRAATAN